MSHGREKEPDEGTVGERWLTAEEKGEKHEKGGTLGVRIG